MDKFEGTAVVSVAVFIAGSSEEVILIPPTRLGVVLDISVTGNKLVHCRD